VKPLGRPAAISLAGLFLALLCACGGKSSAGQPQDTSTFQVAYVGLDSAAKDIGIADVDRAYAFCLGPDDPRPVSTPPPDPSGHSRAQVPCPDAAKLVMQALPAYKAAVDTFQSSSTKDLKDKRMENARSAILKLHQSRLQTFQDVADAANRNDLRALAALRLRYAEIAVLADSSQKAIVGISQSPK
jgi:hypothetical protein